ncbi:hypothetical protein [Streptomyces parvulus]|uniref:Uncharacterized protein n=1 Tax=Streptomyces parvulus TaxID=146923 RepID=A0A191UWT6_9ACTN|nr:hypothetical protein [Streptomyces parvulus]ANJ07153.1 hypothetical protein Spa2297_09135 [Streptomyces parvulus]GGR74369.1 hypothetical protein GCM10010220_28340 [Streptomyces parvulus]
MTQAPDPISQNTGLTLVVVDRAISWHGDLGSYNEVQEILASRDLEQLRELALTAIWQLGTTLHSHAPDTVATVPYPDTFAPVGHLSVAVSTKRATPEGI